MWKSRTPIGRELSENWHVLDVQMHFPATGSQNGVEQLLGTAQFNELGTQM
jgi:hypothetical protein